MGKYMNKSKIAGDVPVKEISRPTTRAAVHRLRSHSTSASDDADSFGYLQLRSRRLVKLPLLTDTRKQRVGENPRAETTSLVKGSDEETGLDFESGERPCNLLRSSEATQSVPSSREIEDFLAQVEQQQERFFMEKYNFDIVSDHPLPGRYEWVKVVCHE